MLFEPLMFAAAGGTIFVVGVEKVAEYYGIYWLGDIVKLVLPLAGLLAGIYFLETNPILGWLK